MNKDLSLKRDPRYGKLYLREKVNESIKRQRDEVCEVKEEPVKMLSDIPVDLNRDGENLLKRYRNKFYPD